MSSLRSIELSLVDEVFRGGERGYILDFSNRTFGDFFVRELDIDIDAPQYAADGPSKGKRLRCFLGQVDDGTAARTLQVLWKHREALRAPGAPDPMPRAASQIAALITRLEGTAPPAPVNVVAAPLLLGWREWFHYQAVQLEAPERYDRVAGWARATLADHAGDPRPDGEPLERMLRGETRDETWNACQRQFLADGWMHNNLRMYWGKYIIAMTPSPKAAWATACYLNDRLSLDGRDPSTYGNIAAMFAGSPSDRERPVYGRVATRGDGSTRHREGGEAWLAAAAARQTPAMSEADTALLSGTPTGPRAPESSAWLAPQPSCQTS